jgi:hypothetical protein
VDYAITIAHSTLALPATGLGAAGNQRRTPFDLNRPLTTQLRI